MRQSSDLRELVHDGLLLHVARTHKVRHALSQWLQLGARQRAVKVDALGQLLREAGPGREVLVPAFKDALATLLRRGYFPLEFSLW